MSSAVRDSATAHRSGSSRLVTPADALGRSPLGTIAMRAPTNAGSRYPSSQHEGGWPQKPAAAVAAAGGVPGHGPSARNRAESVETRGAGGRNPSRATDRSGHAAGGAAAAAALGRRGWGSGRREGGEWEKRGVEVR